MGIYQNNFTEAFLKLLAKSGVNCYQIHQFTHLDQAYLSRLKSGERNNPSPETIVKIGNLGMIKLVNSFFNNENMNTFLIEMSVIWDHLDILNYFVNAGIVKSKEHYKLILQTAIENGRLEILKYLTTNLKYRFDILLVKESMARASDNYVSFGVEDILHTLCWLHSNGVPIDDLSAKNDIETELVTQNMQGIHLNGGTFE